MEFEARLERVEERVQAGPLFHIVPAAAILAACRKRARVLTVNACRLASHRDTINSELKRDNVRECVPLFMSAAAYQFANDRINRSMNDRLV